MGYKMKLEELRKEIERLQKNIRDCEAAEWSSLKFQLNLNYYDIKIKGIKQTVEAVDFIFKIRNLDNLEYVTWQKIKKLLEI